MYLQEVGWRGMNWFDLAQVAGACERGYETSGSIKCGEFLLASQEGPRIMQLYTAD
jgi:hypothetical protein